MDDFGSGYSSLNMLRKSIVDIIKIDMKFLDMNKDDMQKGLTILKSIIDMSNEMHLPIIVEGVETQEQADMLTKMKVRFAQGYLFYRPMHIDEFEQLIQDPDKVDYRGIYNRELDEEEIQQVPEEIFELKKVNTISNTLDFSLSMGGFFAYWNNEAQEIIEADLSIAKIYGCETVDEFLELTGNSFKGMVYPEDWEQTQKDIKRQVDHVEEPKTDCVGYRIRKKDGSVAYVNDFGNLKIDEETGEEYFQVFLFDVTHQIK